MTYEQLPSLLTIREVGAIIRFDYNKSAKIVRTINDEFEKKGFVVMKGRISKQVLFERLGIERASFNINDLKPPKKEELNNAERF